MDLDPEIQAFLDEKCTVIFLDFHEQLFQRNQKHLFDSYDLDQAFFPIADDPEKGYLMNEKKQRTKTKVQRGVYLGGGQFCRGQQSADEQR